MMINSAQNAMIHVMNLNQDDSVLVVTDKYTKKIGEAFYKATLNYGASATIYNLPEKERPLSKVPKEMKDLSNGKTIIINAIKGFGEETPFRVEWLEMILDTKSIRLGHGPGITEAMMIKGPMNIDYNSMDHKANQLIELLEDAKIANISAPGGTDIVLYIEDRGFSTDTQIKEDPLLANLPCGEIWCAPIESQGNGVIVCDGSIGDIGKVKKPLKITVKNGKIVQLESKDKSLIKRVDRLLKVDEEASIIGELGIGLNPGAKLSGILLEDEKALKTAHIAFGYNLDMDGGQNNSKTHRDFLFYDPTIKITYKDGSTKIIIENGNFCF